jgi:hypothetical protein
MKALKGRGLRRVRRLRSSGLSHGDTFGVSVVACCDESLYALRQKNLFVRSA